MEGRITYQLNPLILKRLTWICQLDLRYFLMIILEFRMILQTSSRRVVGIILNIIPLLNLFSAWHLSAKVHQNCRAAFGRCALMA